MTWRGWPPLLEDPTPADRRGRRAALFTEAERFQSGLHVLPFMGAPHQKGSSRGFTPREFRGMEFHEVGHPGRRLAGELAVVIAHPVIAPLLVEFGHYREVVDHMLRQARRSKLFAPLGSRHVAIADRPAECLGEDARIVVQVGRLRTGQIVDVTDVRRRVVEDRRDGAPNVDR